MAIMKHYYQWMAFINSVLSLLISLKISDQILRIQHFYFFWYADFKERSEYKNVYTHTYIDQNIFPAFFKFFNSFFQKKITNGHPYLLQDNDRVLVINITEKDRKFLDYIGKYTCVVQDSFSEINIDFNLNTSSPVYSE